MKGLDSLTEGSARSLAKRTSRRGFIGSLGAILVGASGLPLLPVARGGDAAGDKAKHVNDPTSCDYWRHCAIDGYLCGCCGGGGENLSPGGAKSAVALGGDCPHPPPR